MKSRLVAEGYLAPVAPRKAAQPVDNHLLGKAIFELLLVKERTDGLCGAGASARS